jgi:hypothetical protein
VDLHLTDPGSDPAAGGVCHDADGAPPRQRTAHSLRGGSGRASGQRELVIASLLARPDGKKSRDR